MNKNYTKTNYSAQLAWFEFAVKPYVVTEVPNSTTRCWHPTQERPLVDYNRFRESSIYNRQDSPVPRSNSRKRPRVQSSSPFISTMQDDEVHNHISVPDSTPPLSPSVKFIKLDEAIVFDNKFGDMSLSSQEKPATSDNGKLSRTTSEASLYYDAKDDLLSDNVMEVFEEDDALASTSASLSQTPLSPPDSVATTYKRKEMDALLYQHFHFDCFFPNQFEAINAALNDEDILLVLPSGPSRNICHQFPILYQQETNSIVVVFVPSLLYLLQQDDYMMDIHHIPTLFVSKSKNIYKKNWISSQCLDIQSISKTKLLYIMYDDFSSCKPFFKQLYRQNIISRFILDEAHCLSQWGDDFHFGYLRAAEYIRKKFPNIPISLFTATPSDRIHIDITHNLSLQHCKIFKKSILM